MKGDKFRIKEGHCIHDSRFYPPYSSSEFIFETENGLISANDGYATVSSIYGDSMLNILHKLGAFDSIKCLTIDITKVNEIPQIVEILNACDYPFKIAIEFPDDIDLITAIKILGTIENVDNYVVLYPKIDLETVMQVDKEDRKYLSHFAVDTIILSDDYMDYVDILDFVDQVAEELAEKGSTTIQRVLLLDKYFREHFEYSKDEIDVDRSRNDVGYLLSTGHGVCAAYSTLAQMILSHPILGIKSRIVESENHAWQEIKVDDKWYSYDFTNNSAFTHFVLKISDSFYTFMSLCQKCKLSAMHSFGIVRKNTTEDLMEQVVFRRNQEDSMSSKDLGYTFVNFGISELKYSYVENIEEFFERKYKFIKIARVPVSSGLFYLPRLSVLEHYHGIRHKSIDVPLPTHKSKIQSNDTPNINDTPNKKM